MRRSRLVVAIAAAIVYVGAIALTMALHSGHARPLYDGFVPPSSYRWVEPPAFFASGNEKPKPVHAAIPLTSGGSRAAGIATPDGQFAIDLNAGAIAPRPGATSVTVDITPVAPRELGALPSSLRGNGNAYRVDMHYEPGGQSVRRFTAPGTLLVEIPELGSDLYRSSTGTGWIAIAAHPVGASKLTLAGEFPAPGDYLAATNLPELVTTSRRSSHRALAIGLVAAGVALVLLLVAGRLARRRLRVDPEPS